MRARILATTILSLLLLSPAHGNLLELIGVPQVVEDAGQELRKTIDHAKAAAEALIAAGDKAAEERLKQIDGIQEKAFANANALVATSQDAALKVLREASTEVASLEKQIFADLNETIWRAECASKRILLEDLKDTLGGVGRLLDTHEIVITLPVPKEQSFLCLWDIFCSNGDPKFRAKEPFGETYIEIRDAMLASLDRASDETATHSIVGTYEFISALAKRTSCFYEGTSDVYNREFVEYRQKSLAWRNVLNIEVMK